MTNDIEGDALAVVGSFAILVLLVVAVVNIISWATSFVIGNLVLTIIIAALVGLMGVLAYSTTFRQTYVWTSVVAGHAALLGYSAYEYTTCATSTSCWLPELTLVGPTGVIGGFAVITLVWLGIRHVRQQSGGIR